MKNILIVLFLLVSVLGFSSPIVYDEGYVKMENGKWYFQVVGGNCGGELSFIEIVGIDNPSFKVIKCKKGNYGTWYAKDKNYVYYRGKRIIGADHNSVEILEGWDYIKDKNYVYYDGKRIIGGADPTTFKVLECENYAVDRFGIYYRGTPLMYSLPKNYRFLGDFCPTYVISNNRVFFQESEIKGADAATFEIVKVIVNRYFTIAKDKNHVYIDNQTFTGLDTKTFEIDTVAYVNLRKVRCSGCYPSKEPCYNSDLQVSVKDKNGVYWVKLDEGNLYNMETPRIFRLDSNKGVVKARITDDDDIYVDDGFPIHIDEPPLSRPVEQEYVERYPDIKAQYPGGMTELMKFINDNINYPQDAKDANIQGMVIVEFVVKTDGTIANVRVVKKVHPSLDAEAIRIVQLVQSMPKWKPASSNGVAVASYFQLPVQFRMEQKK
ncbi:MAG: TonB family protein [Bacteroidetes bacterium]|nr:TonB family protein [Bacteroidota bacterium]